MTYRTVRIESRAPCGRSAEGPSGTAFMAVLSMAVRALISP
jgi:hypothetical protein